MGNGFIKNNLLRLQGFIIGIVFALVIVSIVLLKETAEYNYGKTESLQNQIDQLKERIK